MASLELAVCQQPSQSYGYTNKVYVNPADFQRLGASVISVEGSSLAEDMLLISLDNAAVFIVSPAREIQAGSIGVNAVQRKFFRFQLLQKVGAKVYEAPATIALTSLTAQIDLQIKSKITNSVAVDAEGLTPEFVKAFRSHVFLRNQSVAFEYKGLKLEISILDWDKLVPDNLPYGQVHNATLVNFTAVAERIDLTGGVSGPKESLFKAEFDFGKLGIGGLGAQFNTIFRTTFASRMYPTRVVKELGINHVRGMLLFGPPGCGKTLIARKIGEILHAKEPKIVNGPEILDKYVGGGEEKIRKLFADAEIDQKKEKDNSPLHVIIFDEIDAICKQRGSTRDNTGTMDSIVNQLLSKIDGVESLNNILVIGMTNRKDMIDEALLRPGRLEIHVEIGLPDEPGRLQILNIHTKEMRASKRITQEAIDNLPEAARRTKNYSGAEIEGLVKRASSYALSRGINTDSMQPLDESQLIINWKDFEMAIGELQPRLGVNNDELQAYVRNGLVAYGPNFEEVRSTLQRLVDQVRVSERTPILSVLLEGPAATGKTALAAALAINSDFPFIRFISADSMLGQSEQSKSAHILKMFQDSYRSNNAIIILDDLERIIEYSPIGPRYSNTVVQTLLVLLKKPPTDPTKRLLVIGTTSIAHWLDDIQLVSAFNVTLNIPQLTVPTEIQTVLKEVVHISDKECEDIASAITKPIGIKQLLMVTEMARQGEPNISAIRFLECLHICGY